MSDLVVQLEPILVSRDEAATVLSMSLSHFQRYVQPHVQLVYTGEKRGYLVEDLKRWARENAVTAAELARVEEAIAS